MTNNLKSDSNKNIPSSQEQQGSTTPRPPEDPKPKVGNPGQPVKKGN